MFIWLISCTWVHFNTQKFILQMKLAFVVNLKVNVAGCDNEILKIIGSIDYCYELQDNCCLSLCPSIKTYFLL